MRLGTLIYCIPLSIQVSYCCSYQNNNPLFHTASRTSLPYQQPFCLALSFILPSSRLFKSFENGAPLPRQEYIEPKCCHISSRLE